MTNYDDYACALACPAGGASGPPQADDFFATFCIKAKSSKRKLL